MTRRETRECPAVCQYQTKALLQFGQMVTLCSSSCLRQTSQKVCLHLSCTTLLPAISDPSSSRHTAQSPPPRVVPETSDQGRDLSGRGKGSRPSSIKGAGLGGAIEFMVGATVGILLLPRALLR